MEAELAVLPGMMAKDRLRRPPHELRARGGTTAGRAPPPLRGRTRFGSRTFINNGP